jgi:hypothetical protein
MGRIDTHNGETGSRAATPPMRSLSSLSSPIDRPNLRECRLDRFGDPADAKVVPSLGRDLFMRVLFQRLPVSQRLARHARGQAYSAKSGTQDGASDASVILMSATATATSRRNEPYIAKNLECLRRLERAEHTSA